MYPKIPSTLGLGKIINGISKSINIINQIIPIYEQTKPMIFNAKKAFSSLKNINIKNIPNNSENKKVIKTQYSNNPSFFK